MKPALEGPRPGLQNASVVAFWRRETFYPWGWHYHPEIELTWIRRGKGQRLVGDHSDAYEGDDLVLLGSNVPHTWFSDPNHKSMQEALVVQFRPSMLPESLLGLKEFAAIGALLARAVRGLRFSREALRGVKSELCALPKKQKLEAWTGTVSVLHRLAEDKQGMPLASEGYHHGRSFQLNTRLERLTSFVEKNCREDIPLDRAARLAGMTPAAFSRFFRKMTGRTFVSFRNLCRIREASRLLIETDRPVTEIAYDCGFGNLANFHRRFAQVHRMTPGHYRRLHTPPASDFKIF